MTYVLLSIRIPANQDLLLKQVAKARGITRYHALGRAIEQGLGQMTNAPVPSGNPSASDELATLSARLALIEALTDRSLFTASAAYVYARRGALRGDNESERVKVEAVLSESVKAAYQRQRTLAAEAL